MSEYTDITTLDSQRNQLCKKNLEKSLLRTNIAMMLTSLLESRNQYSRTHNYIHKFSTDRNIYEDSYTNLIIYYYPDQQTVIEHLLQVCMVSKITFPMAKINLILSTKSCKHKDYMWILLIESSIFSLLTIIEMNTVNQFSVTFLLSSIIRKAQTLTVRYF